MESNNVYISWFTCICLLLVLNTPTTAVQTTHANWTNNTSSADLAVFCNASIPTTESTEKLKNASRNSKITTLKSDNSTVKEDHSNQINREQNISSPVTECVDTRSDCKQFSNGCQSLPDFVLQGCRKSCNLCQSEIYPIPQIILDNMEQDANGSFRFNVSCTASISHSLPEMLSLQCDDVSKCERPPVTGVLSITVLSVNKSTGCTCSAIYNSGITYNRSVHQVFFAGHIALKPTFYIKSLSGTGANITVWENQSVSFVCFQHDWKSDLLSMYKGTILISFFNFSITYTIERLRCSDSGEYRCVADNYKGVNSTSVTLSVLCDTDNCVDNEECSVNGTAFPNSCSNTSWHSKHCPVSCKLCSPDNITINGEALTTLTNHVIIIVVITGASVITILIFVFMQTRRGYRIKSRYDDTPQQEEIVQRDITPTSRESNGNVHNEINGNQSSPCKDVEGFDYCNPIYVPWEPPSDPAKRHQCLTLSVHRDSKIAE